MNTSTFIKELANRCGYKLESAREIYYDVFSTLIDIVVKEKEDLVLNNFCTFKHKKCSAYRTYSPLYGLDVEVPETDRVIFKFAKSVTPLINGKKEEKEQEDEET